ncbi:MAG: NTP transferase domain-containing protein [bacterium]|nr:NTP transferase domain-containing protein [bacterium]
MSKRAVILAGGLGTRLKPFTEIIPKPLLPIGEKAVLEIQIELLKKHGFSEIFLATNYKSEYIERFLGDGSHYGVKLFISKETRPLGTAGPLKLLASHLSEPFLVMNGDILTLMNFAKFYDFAMQKEALLTVAIKKIITPYEFGNIFFDRDFVTDIEEKPSVITFALAGIYVLQPEIFPQIPAGKTFGMDALIKCLLKQQLPVAKYEIDEYWLDIGHVDDYSIIQEDYKRHFISHRPNL